MASIINGIIINGVVASPVASPVAPLIASPVVIASPAVPPLASPVIASPVVVLQSPAPSQVRRAWRARRARVNERVGRPVRRQRVERGEQQEEAREGPLRTGTSTLNYNASTSPETPSAWAGSRTRYARRR